ncbi:MAG: sigma factor [Verrucomicrobiota bacterium]
MSQSTETRKPEPLFVTTRWSVVLAARRTPSPESAAAMETICHAYWYPLYAYARRCGQSPADAQDLTQEFFRLLLEKRWFEDVDREKGRLRSFLVTAMKHFMAKEWRRANAQRRGGGSTHVTIDTAIAEGRYATEPETTLAADEVFDRQWALSLLDFTIERLQAEYTSTGRGTDFGILKDCLTASHGTIDYASIARQLATTEGAARVAIHRLRKRFRQIYREEIAHTMPDGAEAEAEMRHLANALART